MKLGMEIVFCVEERLVVGGCGDVLCDRVWGWPLCCITA